MDVSDWLSRAQQCYTYLDVVNLLVSGVDKLSSTMEEGTMEKNEQPPIG